MKTTTKTTYITNLFLTAPFTYHNGEKNVTLPKGKIVETIRHNRNHYNPNPVRITLGHGWTETIPTNVLKAKWFKEVKTTKVNVKTVEVKA